VVDEFQARIEELRARKEKNLQMGGSKKVARQHARGKLHVRERLDLLFDPGTFVELGAAGG
jgi:acetyl-CoA carboxylase carboxyltransferase component